MRFIGRLCFPSRETADAAEAVLRDPELPFAPGELGRRHWMIWIDASPIAPASFWDPTLTRLHEVAELAWCGRVEANFVGDAVDYAVASARGPVGRGEVPVASASSAWSPPPPGDGRFSMADCDVLVVYSLGQRGEAVAADVPRFVVGPAPALGLAAAEPKRHEREAFGRALHRALASTEAPLAPEWVAPLEELVAWAAKAGRFFLAAREPAAWAGRDGAHAQVAAQAQREHDARRRADQERRAARGASAPVRTPLRRGPPAHRRIADGWPLPPGVLTGAREGGRMVGLEVTADATFEGLDEACRRLGVERVKGDAHLCRLIAAAGRLPGDVRALSFGKTPALRELAEVLSPAIAPGVEALELDTRHPASRDALLRGRAPLRRLDVVAYPVDVVRFATEPSWTATLEGLRFHVAGAWMKPQHIEGLAAARLPALRELSLRETPLDDERGVVLLSAPWVAHLERLDVRWCRLGAASMLALARHARSLRLLELTGNAIDAEGREALRALPNVEVVE